MFGWITVNVASQGNTYRAGPQNGDGSWGEWTFAEYADKVDYIWSLVREEAIAAGAGVSAGASGILPSSSTSVVAARRAQSSASSGSNVSVAS